MQTYLCSSPLALNGVYCLHASSKQLLYLQLRGFVIHSGSHRYMLYGMQFERIATCLQARAYLRGQTEARPP